MICANCSKLAILHTNRTCSRCKGSILNNISAICEPCANKQDVCSVCLKNNKSGLNSSVYKGGCKSCG